LENEEKCFEIEEKTFIEENIKKIKIHQN